jgi:archaellum biogenesis ATPase FlaH
VYNVPNPEKVNFVSADKLNISEEKLETGYNGLDRLIGCLESAQTYLFYGGVFLDEFVHRLMVRGCKIGTVAYLNNTNYYSEKTLLHPDKIAFYAKREGIEPEEILKRVFFSAAYNELRQEKAASELLSRIKQEKSTKLVILHNITKFLSSAKDRNKATESVNSIISSFWQLCSEYRIILVITTEPRNETAIRIPNPEATSLMMHLSRVIVFLRDRDFGAQAVVIKHHSISTPAYVEIENSQIDIVSNQIRTRLDETIKKLSDSFVPLLRDKETRDAFQKLREVWEREVEALCNREMPTLFDSINFISNLHNKSELEELVRRVESIENRLKETKNAKP